MRRSQHALIIFTIVTLNGGCEPKAPSGYGPTPVFPTGTTRVFESHADYVVSIPPGITIIKPKAGVEIQFGERFACEVKITVPEGGRLPMNVYARLMQGNRKVVINELSPKVKLSEHEFIYSSSLPASRKPGNYNLLAEVRYLE